MKIKEGYKQFGGKRKFKALCDTVAKKYGIVVLADECVNEEDPTESQLCVYFEFSASKDWHKFEDARMDVINGLLPKGLTLQYTCNGDGNIGAIMLYEVIYS